MGKNPTGCGCQQQDQMGGVLGTDGAPPWFWGLGMHNAAAVHP